MVYRGPSKGCKKCRSRRVKVSLNAVPACISRVTLSIKKCDQTWPACVNCSERGNLCPGYRDIFERIHRDETVKVIKRNSKPSSSTISASETLPTSRICIFSHRQPLGEILDSGLDLDAQGGLSDTAEIFSGMLFSTPGDVVSEALSFFFLQYGLNDAQATCSFFNFLPAMYSSSSASSPLAGATAALAVQVVGLHKGHGAETVMAHRLYAEAVIRTKDAIGNPRQSKSDELLMTTLVLEAYESTKATFGKSQLASQPQGHLLGSIALLKHRGELNYRNQLSWGLVVATRSRLLRQVRHSVDKMANIEALCDTWNGGQNKPQSPAVETDTLLFELVRLQCLLQHLQSGRSRGQHRVQGDDADTHAPNKVMNDGEHFPSILSGAIHLASACSNWYTGLPLSWQPVPVPACAFAPSIQGPGVYEHARPATYTNIYIANSLNRHRVTELGVIFFIRKCLTAISDRSKEEELLLLGLIDRAQFLMDEVCASVPFLFGDMATPGMKTEDTLALHSPVPSAQEERRSFPDNTTEHERQVSVSGRYMVYRTLTAVLELLGEGGHLGGNRAAMRGGQEEWMRRQVARLERVFRGQNCFIN